MTKNIFIVAIAVLLSVAFCSLSAQNVSKDYNVGDFSVINLQSAGNIIFTQSAECRRVFCHKPAICREYYFYSIGRMLLPFGRSF